MRLLDKKAEKITYGILRAESRSYDFLRKLWFNHDLNLTPNLIQFLNGGMDHMYPCSVRKKLNFVEAFDMGGQILEKLFCSIAPDVKEGRKPFVSVKRLLNPAKRLYQTFSL